MTKVLVFDLGGVLIMNDLFDELAKLMSNEIDENSLKDKWLRSPAVRTFERGLSTPDVFAASMIEEFELTTTPSQFLDAFTNWPKGFYSGAEAKLNKLRSIYTTACLSNSNELHWTTELTANFDLSYSSHLLNLVKPDKDVFEFVTADIGCKPSEIVFFDDSKLNVDAAQSFGWEAHLTIGYQDLLQALKTIGAPL